MAAAAWWLLGREADRVESLTAGTLANRTATVAESLDLLMREVREGVTEGLVSVRRAPDPRIALAELVEGNPYLSAGFYFRSLDKVTFWFGDRDGLPSPGAISEEGFPWTLPNLEGKPMLDSQEEQEEQPSRLTAQSNAPSDAYSTAPAPDAEDLDEAFADPQAPVTKKKDKTVSQNLALRQQREAVRKVNVDNQIGLSRLFESEVNPQTSWTLGAAAEPASRERRRAPMAETVKEARSARLQSDQAPGAEIPQRRGWVRSVVEGEEQWMAWSNLAGGINYAGAWLNRDAIEAELSKAISLSQQDGLRFRLVDSEGILVSGGRAPAYKSSAPDLPELSLAVGTALPGWRVETFRANGVNTFGSSFRLVGGLFIAGLSFAILLGASVLIWQARRDARDAERKTTFVANVSHELKTPLTSIRLFADMLYEGRIQDPARQRTYLRTMVGETQRLTRLVNNVLDFSRLERGTHRSQKSQREVGELVSSIIETQRERLSAEGLELNYVPPQSPLEAQLDADALEQILLNLLDNAAKYAHAGGRADITLENQASGWCLRVRDYGPGIPASAKKRVFQAFQRLDDRLTSNHPGCGLGLSIAARLAQEMGGHLTLEHTPPPGCTFCLTVYE